MIDIEEVPEFYRGYVIAAGSGPLVPALLKSGDDFISLVRNLPERKGLHRYAADKWSIKDLIQHIVDSERVFTYRALRFARNDKTELSGFDQDLFVSTANADSRSNHQLLSEFTNVRAGTIDLFSSFSEEMKKQQGSASGVSLSVEVIGYIIVGHLVHHMNIIKERYI